MGLDQYLLAKRKQPKSTEATGACGGLFPLTIDTDGCEEIGYWRKAYDVDEYILSKVLTLSQAYDDVNLVALPVSSRAVDDILEHAVSMHKEIVKNKTTDEEQDKDEYDWQKTVEIFTLAQELIKTEQAEIFYKIWY